MTELLIIVVSLLLSYTGIYLYRIWSVENGVIDLPNSRSSHRTPTPRGGGIIIASLCLAAYAAITYSLGHPISLGYLVGGVIVVAVSWRDDLKSVSSLFRISCHVAAAALLVASTGPITVLSIVGAGLDIELGSASYAFTILWVVWLVNAYNFMDGIDGIAGLQAVVGGICWTVVATTGGADVVFYYSLVLIASASGFLLQNWQPAKIFMGDAGSAFLGFTYAALPLLASRQNGTLSGFFASAGIAIVWFFLFDTVATMILRVFRVEKIWRPHRSHFYQRLVISGLSHRVVAGSYGALSLAAFVCFYIAYKFGGKVSVLNFLYIIGASAALAFLALRKVPVTDTL